MELRRSPGFWTLALGVALREGATEATVAEAVEDMLALLTPARGDA